MLVISSNRFELHVTPPGHPERPQRAHVFDAVASRWIERGGTAAEPRPAARHELDRVHTPSYLDSIEALSGKTAMLDPDTYISPESYDISLIAAGAAVQAAEHAISHHEPAFALVRPPGHHAEPDRAMGFCLYNNIAVAAAAMLARGLNRIAIVDIDVHHGNGTQAMFYDDPRVLYVSSHQYPFYPGTGAATETGDGDGRGFTVNIPMEAGSDDADYELVYRVLVAPILEEFRPALILVSAGYDAHERDPLASMRVTTSGYGAIVRVLREAAVRSGALALVTEGGYELTALAGCLEESFAALSEPQTSGRHAIAPAAAGVASPRGERAVASVRAALRPFWRGL
jgi:acetoin utilization deacetylase AcuC-like enzyme